MLESLMESEFMENSYEESVASNKCNSYRSGLTYWYMRTLIFRIPRDRFDNFNICILVILRD